MTNLQIFTNAEALLHEIERDMTAFPQGAEQENLIEQLLDASLYR